MVLSVRLLLILATALPLAGTAVADDGQLPPQTSWVLSAPMGTPPQRISDLLPLAYQSDKTWVPAPELSDEFNAEHLDVTKWYATNPDWPGRQPSFYSPRNVEENGGELKITMRRETPSPTLQRLGYRDWSSGAIKSRRATLYGYFEIRARAMGSAGSSAFWLYNRDATEWTEIDIFEVWVRSAERGNDYTMSVHVFDLPKGVPDRSATAVWHPPFALDGGFHVYGLEWTPEELVFHVDGIVVHRRRNTSWHQPLFINLDSEIMEQYAGLPKDTDLPSVFEVDYVRVWKRAGAGPPSIGTPSAVAP